MFAGLVHSPEEYIWSSFGFHINETESHLIVDHRLYQELGDNKSDRADNYRALFKYEFDKKLFEYIAETIKLGQVLGGDQFKDRIERITNQRVRPLRRGRPKKGD
ncbi:hypothetical protein MAH4_34300 [Sessilibacter sp. MAH4]